MTHCPPGQIWVAKWPSAPKAEWSGGQMLTWSGGQGEQMAGCLHGQRGRLPDAALVRWPHHHMASLSGYPMITWSNEPFVLWWDGHLIALVTGPSEGMNKKLA